LPTQGLHVLVCGRTLSKVEETAHWIRSTGASADALACDVTSQDDQKTVFDEAGSCGQPLAAVIYNAGNNAPIPFEDLTPDNLKISGASAVSAVFLQQSKPCPC
jgi:short-subunit dehydrogenase